MAEDNDPETSQEETARKRRKHQIAFEQSRDAIMFFEGESFQDCNPAALAMFRVPDVATFVTLRFDELSPPYQPDGRSSGEAATNRFDEALSQGQAFFEWRHRTWDGIDFPAEVWLSRVDLEEGPLVQALVRDITERHRLEGGLRRLAAILDSTPDMVTMHDGDGALLYLNNTGRRLVGLPERSSQALWRPKTGWDRFDLPPETESLEGTWRWIHPPAEAEKLLNEGFPTAWKEGSWRGETVVLDREGKEIPVSEVLIVHRDDAGDANQIATILRDISTQKELEALLKRSADTDHLTGLYNRQRFDSEMQLALARYARYGTETCLMMIDLDYFKSVNDTYGHDVGDQVLVELTKRLSGEIREADFLARWGGEEFVVLLPETDAPEAAQMGERLRRRIEVEPFPDVGGLTISLGITNFRDEDTPATLINRADAALYEAKRAGRNRLVFHDNNPSV